MRFLTLVMCLFVFPLSFFLHTNSVLAQEVKEESLSGVVTKILEETETEFEGTAQKYQKLQVLITDGSLADRSLIIENGGVATTNSIFYKEGDEVIVSYLENPDGEELFYIVDYQRQKPLLLLFVLFATLTVLIGGLRGLSSIFGMILSFFVIALYIVPKIASGVDPIFVAVTGSGLIIILTFYLSHGVSRKTHIAVVSTLLTLLITGLLGSAFIEATRLTGFASEEASFVQTEISQTLNMKGLLLAGIIIATVGILDDITISQASIVLELKKANAKLKGIDLFIRSMRVGRDHISSLVNTLVLVYAGASLPLLLLFVENPRPFGMLVSFEMVADEIVKTLIGSIGLICAVPITSALAAYLYSRTKSVKEVGHTHSH